MSARDWFDALAGWVFIGLFVLCMLFGAMWVADTLNGIFR